MLNKLKNNVQKLINQKKKHLPDILNKFRSILHTHPIHLKKGLLISFLLLVLLYYPLGAFLTHNIKTDTSYDISSSKSASATIDALSYLLYQEVYDNTWTPALPFIFPASILDNMPSFQKGVLSAIRKTSSVLAKSLKTSANLTEDHPLQKAANLLKYPSSIWMFSPSNQLIPAPSSNSQYRRARKHLQKYNKLLTEKRGYFSPTPEELYILLQSVNSNVFNSALKLETHIREHSGIIDSKADDQFYFVQGQLFGYYIILKGISADYKTIIIDYNIYSQFTTVQKALENASLLKPLIVHNANPEDTIGANHLFTLGYYALKASALLQQIASKLPSKNNKGTINDD